MIERLDEACREVVAAIADAWVEALFAETMTSGI